MFGHPARPPRHAPFIKNGASPAVSGSRPVARMRQPAAKPADAPEKDDGNSTRRSRVVRQRREIAAAQSAWPLRIKRMPQAQGQVGIGRSRGISAGVIAPSPAVAIRHAMVCPLNHRSGALLAPPATTHVLWSRGPHPDSVKEIYQWPIRCSSTPPTRRRPGSWWCAAAGSRNSTSSPPPAASSAAISTSRR